MAKVGIDKFAPSSKRLEARSNKSRLIANDSGFAWLIFNAMHCDGCGHKKVC